ncbi:hypothetical protein Nepgr_024731 [Nepenthes gracilis]|uniref:Uncharacterized protein n=1 Tax=Nepenthes gracilis TaxID=150966 RepID=A0AAD3XZ27_NEPGR|nr:hypothetical protein Nepgr_024731 [Nepenthes gracilis]
MKTTRQQHLCSLQFGHGLTKKQQSIVCSSIFLPAPMVPAVLPDFVDFDGVPQGELDVSVQRPGILDSEVLGNGLASTVKSPEGSLPCNPGSSDAGGLEAGASPLACSSPSRQSLLCPSSGLLVVSTASANIPAPGGDVQYCPGSQYVAPVIPRSSSVAALPPGVAACNYGVSWSSVVQQNTLGGVNRPRFWYVAVLAGLQFFSEIGGLQLVNKLDGSCWLLSLWVAIHCRRQDVVVGSCFFLDELEFYCTWNGCPAAWWAGDTAGMAAGSFLWLPGVVVFWCWG